MGVIYSHVCLRQHHLPYLFLATAADVGVYVENNGGSGGNHMLQYDPF